MLLRSHLPLSLILVSTSWGMLCPSIVLSQSRSSMPVEIVVPAEPSPPSPRSTPPSPPTISPTEPPTSPAQPDKPATEKEPLDSLEITEPDPLLPRIPVKRPLSRLERLTLTEALAKLEAEAQAARQKGDLATAFKIWNRSLRLQRFLGVITEVRALGQVGNIAWEESQPVQVRLIRGRLQAIQEQYLPALTQRSTALPQIPVSEQVPPDPSLMLPQLPIDPVDTLLLQRALGIAYQQIRSRPLALVVYEQQLADARQRRDRTLEQAILVIIGGLHFNWFDYANAVRAYRDLLPLAPVKITAPPVKRSDDRALDDPPLLTKTEILQRIIYMQEQDQLWLAAIDTQEELITLMRSQQQTDVIPGLRLAIARNYRAAKQTELAIDNYRQAYTLAQPLRQFAYASDALREVAELYLAQNQPRKTLEIYQFLLAVDQQAYNTYGRMTTYDQIGKLYRQLGDAPNAITAFQQGLTLARQLKYQEDYFLKQLEAARNPTPSQ